MAKRVASALKSASKTKRKKKARRAMNKDVVAEHLANLEKALGKKGDFDTVFKSLKDDRRVLQAEAVGIASKFVVPLAASTSKKKAFDAIWERHQNLLSFRLRRKAVGGRSAA